MSVIANSSNLRTIVHFLLSHHDYSHLTRCISVSFYGKQVWICSRCLGLVGGYISTWILLLSFSIFHISISFSSFTLFTLIGFLSLLAMIDWSFQTILQIESSNPRRLFTGIFLGVGLALSSKLPSKFLLLGLGVALITLFLIIAGLFGVRHLIPSEITQSSQTNDTSDLI
ncbi:MAG: DUF2085 domain-containing protein [Promethearchaeota archaeon]